MNEAIDWKVTVTARDNRHARQFQSVYYVTASNAGGARSWARLRWADEWEGQDVTWLHSKAEEVTDPILPL
jgi:hypothetical protein